jgi:hypothetical protein
VDLPNEMFTHCVNCRQRELHSGIGVLAPGSCNDRVVVARNSAPVSRTEMPRGRKE